MERDAIEDNIKFIHEIDLFNSYVESRIPIELRENTELMNKLISTKEKLLIAREHFILDFSHLSKNKENFEEDCDNPNYTQERISYNGKSLIYATDKIILDTNQFISLAIKALIEALETISIRQKDKEVEKVMEKQEPAPDIFKEQEIQKTEDEIIKERLEQFGVKL